MIVIYTTFPNKKQAEKLAKILLRKRLTACLNCFSITSFYRWQGKIEKAKEWAMFIKTEKKNYQKIEKLIKKNHHYQVPAIFSWSIEKAEKDYLRWLRKEIK